MSGSPPNWPFALLASILFTLGVIAALLLFPSREAQFITTAVSAMTASLLAVVLVLRSERGVHLRRERNAWLLMLLSIVVSLLATLPWTLNILLQMATAIPTWTFPVYVLSYVLLWAGLSRRTGHYPPNMLGRLVVCCDIFITLSAITAIAYHLPWPGHLFSGQLPFHIQALGLGLPMLAVATLVAIILLVFNAVPRQLHRARTVLVIGILMVLTGDAACGYLLLYGHAHAAYLADMLGSLGFLWYAVSLMQEKVSLQSRSRRGNYIDPFPLSIGLIVPVALVLTAMVLAIHRVTEADASGFAAVSSTLITISVLVGLIMVRQFLTFESDRRLYATLQQLYAEMAKNAATDPITGIANHRHFMERFTKEMRRATRYKRPLSLIFADLDHFKQVNDTYGHTIGDQALISVAEGLRNGVRDSDLVARYGGEEFVILLPETTLFQAEVLAERLRQAIAAGQIPLSQREVLRLTISCGVAAYPSTAVNLEDLLAAADSAMYRAKEEGRNRVCSADMLAPHQRSQTG